MLRHAGRAELNEAMVTVWWQQMPLGKEKGNGAVALIIRCRAGCRAPISGQGFARLHYEQCRQYKAVSMADCFEEIDSKKYHLYFGLNLIVMPLVLNAPEQSVSGGEVC